MLRKQTWSPISFVYLFGGGLFSLLSREFAPLAVRLASAASRLRGLPAALEAARAMLEDGGQRPVSAFHTEKAIATMLAWRTWPAARPPRRSSSMMPASAAT